ncbi:RNA recognition motif family protein [Candida albicans]|uniref:RNA recognition motif family protein n=1 Tax=Candida albicans TaxID=5476 RepID=A0A8H6BV23_CANAX|nr:RNA recognition motif family protein [Candida albicans]
MFSLLPCSETEEERQERLAKQEEIDGRSVYVGNVDYQSTPEQLEEFFHGVGVIERVTILFDRFSGLPKGYAYIEFEQTESVQKAIDELHGKEFRGRELRVTAKRTNLPGFRRGRGRGGFRARGRGRGGFRGRGRGRGGFNSRGTRNGDSEQADGDAENEETD